jgi:hypothetical protein
VDNTNDDVPADDRAPGSKIRMLAFIALFCERLMGDPSCETQMREQAARLYGQWIGFVRHDRWFSGTVSPPQLSAEGETLVERMESFLGALADRLRKARGAESRRRGKDGKRRAGRLVGRAVSRIEEKGRRVLLAMAAHIGGKSGKAGSGPGVALTAFNLSACR